MSRFQIDQRHWTQLALANIPGIDGLDHYLQPRATPEPCNMDGAIPGATVKRAASLNEGDLVTGFIDINNQRAHMVSAIRNEGHALEKNELVHIYPFLADYLADVPVYTR